MISLDLDALIRTRVTAFPMLEARLKCSRHLPDFWR
jgi:hypothetical protein